MTINQKKIDQIAQSIAAKIRQANLTLFTSLNQLDAKKHNILFDADSDKWSVKIKSLFNPDLYTADMKISDYKEKEFYIQNWKRIMSSTFKHLFTERNSELLVVLDDDVDADLLAVIKMRHIRCQSKTPPRDLILLNRAGAVALKSETMHNSECNFDVKKLGILHHWSERSERDDKLRLGPTGNPLYTADIIANFVKDCALRMPNLTDVVLRGCASAGAPDLTYLTAKKITLVSSKKNILDLKLDADTLLFQQHNLGEPNTKTTVRYLDSKGEHVIKELPGIPFNLGNKINPEVFRSLEILSAENQLPLLEQRKTAKKDWSTDISKKTSLKGGMFIRDKTMEMAAFKPSLAEKVKAKLDENKIDVTVKGYVHDYYAEGDKVIGKTHHDHGKYPKAIRVRSKKR